MCWEVNALDCAMPYGGRLVQQFCCGAMARCHLADVSPAAVRGVCVPLECDSSHCVFCAQTVDCVPIPIKAKAHVLSVGCQGLVCARYQLRLLLEL